MFGLSAEEFRKAFDALMGGLSGAHGEVTALLKDIKKSNEQIVSLLHNSRAAPMTDGQSGVAAGSWDRLCAKARSVVIDGHAYKTNGSVHPAAPSAPSGVTRAQVERCILRATQGRHDIIATYTFTNAVDNIMELLAAPEPATAVETRNPDLYYGGEGR